MDLTKYNVCSGSTWEGGPPQGEYTVYSEFLASNICGKKDLDISDTPQYFDGIKETPSFIDGSDQHFHGSGSTVVTDPNIGELAYCLYPRYDPNEKNTHKPYGPHLNLDLYWYHKELDGTVKKGKICLPSSVHATSSKEARVKVTNLYGEKKEEFVDHLLKLEHEDE